MSHDMLDFKMKFLTKRGPPNLSVKCARLIKISSCNRDIHRRCSMRFVGIHTKPFVVCRILGDTVL